MSVNISAKEVNELRQKTGSGMMDCKKALVEAGGDFDKAIDILRKKGQKVSAARSNRETSEGVVIYKLSPNEDKASILSFTCETDFVAKNEDFQEFAKNIAMHIAATNPLGVRPEDVPEKTIQRERDIYQAQAAETGKPENVISKIVDGKMNKFFKENCLLNQPYVRDPDLTVEDVLNELIAKIGENITIRRFVRFQTGEASE